MTPINYLEPQKNNVTSNRIKAAIVTVIFLMLAVVTLSIKSVKPEAPPAPSPKPTYYYVIFDVMDTSNTQSMSLGMPILAPSSTLPRLEDLEFGISHEILPKIQEQNPAFTRFFIQNMFEIGAPKEGETLWKK